jgi:hypothetical protein
MNNRQHHRQDRQKWLRRHPKATAAHNAVRVALAQGQLCRPSACDLCDGGGKIEAHHVDHEYGLDVMWLCRSCHQSLHTKKGLDPGLDKVFSKLKEEFYRRHPEARQAKEEAVEA